ncbi:hypothetical protein N7504_011357 [Penicillium tannophilum]|nr:hypothetical protein N7504_011357 [Penicillium tannophilum]
MTITIPSNDFHVIIVGAGATGLLIAQGLKKAGISATIFEKCSEKEYEERSGKWTMALHWSIQHIEACLPPKIFEQLKSAETNPWEEQDPAEAGSIPVVNGRTGELMAKVPMPHPKRIVRGKLRDLFRKDIDVQFGHILTDLQVDEEGVTAIFNKGEKTVKGAVLIGADGARSAVRDHLVDTKTGQLDKANVMILNAYPTFTEEQALYIRSKGHPIAQVFPPIADVVDVQKPETWAFQIILSIWTDEAPPTSDEERRHLFRSYLSTYCEPYRSVAAWLADDIHISGESFHYWGNITPWDNYAGKVTLAGDAAHPMVPFRAAGLNNAMEDARLYVDAIKAVVHKNESLRCSIDVYDGSAFKRGKADIESSNDQMFAYHHWDVVMNGPLMKGGYMKSNEHHAFPRAD